MPLAHADHKSALQTIPLKTLRNGFVLPMLGLGTWMMGGDMVADPSADLVREVDALQAGLALGFRHIDTAEIYAGGVTEKVVATAINDFSRDDLILASKAFRTHHGYDDLLKALQGSLQRLGTDYLDLYYLHAPNLEIPLAETARALNAARRDGLIRHIAVSNFRPERLEELQKHLESPIVANQVHYNLVFREPEAVGMFEHAEKHDYFIVAWRPLQLQKRNVDPATTQKNIWEIGAYPALDDIAAAAGKTNVQVALNWIASHKHAVALIKSSNPAHLQEAIDACSWQLSEADVENLSQNFQPQISISDTIPLQ